MTCARCQQPILPGEDYKVIDKFATSGAGPTMHVHRECPDRPGGRAAR